jgi:Zn-dependent peptidase ImmA (M78 family)
MAGAHREDVPSSWKVFRARLIGDHDQLTLRALLAFAWDLGVVVLPLNDPGVFHGACWRIDKVNVVLLKQSSKYAARWVFDLLHELFHAAQNPQAPTLEVVEAPETSEERRESQEEKAAMRFAGNVALNGSAEALARKCVSEARGDLRRLKSAVQAVAASENVDLGLLANYLAFRLSFQGENWWGTAANLQSTDDHPLMLTRAAFFEHFDFSQLDEGELELLTLALND